MALWQAAGLLCFALGSWPTPQDNLALTAQASASESQDGLPASLANDGREDTRWSGIPGHNSGVWFQLAWDKPVTVAEVLVRQYQRYTFEWDVEVWDADRGDWRVVRHDGRPGRRLPGLVLVPIVPPVRTTRVRVANITNGPSFTEVEVYGPEHRHPPVVSLASDLRGNVIGIVCDALGAGPVVGRKVDLSGFLARDRATPVGWRAQALTDAHGMFHTPLPLGLTGSLTARLDGEPAQTFPAAGFQRSVRPLDAGRPPTTLDTGWHFRPDPPRGFESPGYRDVGWSPIKVPAHWEMEGFHPRSGVGGYRLRFDAPPGSGRVVLRFDGVYSGAEVWVNGSLVSVHEGGFTPFEADVTGVCRAKGNVLAVRVREHTNTSDNLDKMSQYADFPLAGIMRKVTLFRVPAVHVEGLEEATTVGAGGQSAQVTGRLRLANWTDRPAQVSLEARLTDDTGRAAARSHWVVARIEPRAVGETKFSMLVDRPRLWNAEHPRLYTLVLVARALGSEHTVRQRIGLRQTEVRGSQILINGSPVKFRGTCHHDSHPLLGRAVTPALTLKDLAMMKDANLNAVRTSHYPPVPELLDGADALGLYVEDEASFCWVGVSDDLRNTPRILQLTAELLARDRNHPSVFMWSLCNESDFGFGFERSHEWVREADPSRPTAAATSAWLEVATLHNPISVKRIEENETLDKPLLFDEAFAPFQGIFNDVGELWVDPGIRDYFAEPLIAVQKAMMASKVTQGSMIWAWSDDLFCVPARGIEYGRGTTQSHFVDDAYVLPGRGLVGDAPWGVVDGWRRPKPEFWIAKKLFSPVKMEERAIDPIKAIRLTVRNEYDFRNLSELDVAWSNGGEPHPLRLDVRPRSSGTLTVPSRTSPKDVTVTFREKDGRLVDAFVFRVPRLAPTPPNRRGPLTVWDESVLAGTSTHIAGEGFELAFDKDGGFLRRCVVNGHPVLFEFPAVHVLPTADPFSPIPRRTTWHLSSMTVQRASADVVVILEGTYPDFEGRYVLTVTPQGTLDVRSSFTYRGPEVLAREVGMALSVPRACNVMTWDRNAEWGFYPEDHIGRPRGRATSFAVHAPSVPPAWPWSQDNSPMGSNDFRSTKRHVNWASVSYPGGTGLLVRSDGKQAVRAQVESDRVSVFVNDWYGGTNVGWWEWVMNYGRGRLMRTGEVVDSHLRLALVP